MRRLLFYRDYHRFTGGHLKFWDYYNHVRASGLYQPELVFSADSVWDASNPWLPVRESVLMEPLSFRPDALFLGGMDWANAAGLIANASDVPILNLIQNVTHADPGPLRDFLKNKAVRICVSSEVADAVRGTGEVNGPLYVIANGLAVDKLPAPRTLAQRDIDLLVVGNKAPKLAELIVPQLKALGINFKALLERTPRGEFLDWINRARVTLFLPRKREGFYLPQMEGMALETVVVCADCVGNRSFAQHGVNCFKPEGGPQAMVKSAQQALALAPAPREAMLAAGRATAAAHSMARERAAFLKILVDLQGLWRAI
ncbi:MAG TPA: glycosyltransferase [Gammaproteobacteria bacterium]|jgi:glycosyltransferase involved in cell wall biosynthesis